jgi:hypothetical protein
VSGESKFRILKLKIQKPRNLTCFVSVEFDLTVRDEERFRVLESTLHREVSEQKIKKVIERWEGGKTH